MNGAFVIMALGLAAYAVASHVQELKRHNRAMERCRRIRRLLDDLDDAIRMADRATNDSDFSAHVERAKEIQEYADVLLKEGKQ